MKLLADRMLGTLSKWLRLLGFDTAFPGECDDSELLDIAKTEARALLTRDKLLVSRANKMDIQALLVDSVDLEEQLREVMQAFELRIGDVLSRCAVCNSELDKVEKEIARRHIPEAIYFTHDVFWVCRKCNKYYWRGSHWDNMNDFIDGLSGTT